MKLLCSESNSDICEELLGRLSNAGIDAEIRPRTPSLFDKETGITGDASHEIWILNDEDVDKAHAVLYPEDNES